MTWQIRRAGDSPGGGSSRADSEISGRIAAGPQHLHAAGENPRTRFWPSMYKLYARSHRQLLQTPPPFFAQTFLFSGRCCRRSDPRSTARSRQPSPILALPLRRTEALLHLRPPRPGCPTQTMPPRMHEQPLQHWHPERLFNLETMCGLLKGAETQPRHCRCARKM